MKLTISFIFLFSANIFSQWVNLNPIQPFEDLHKIDFINQNTGWIVGNQGIVLHTSDGGANWEYRNTPSASLTNIDFVNANTGYVSSENNVMYKTTNGGSNWFQLNMNNYSPIHSYYFADANNGIVCAGDNLIKTTNGGANWNAILTGSGRYFFYTCFINSSTGYVSSFYGELLKTTNFGNNWTANSAPYGKIFFANENTGWLYEGNQFVNTLRKTTNGGMNWFVQSHPLTRLLSIEFVDANTGYGIGYPNTMYTTNGGNNWSILQAGSEGADVKALNSNSAVIAGGYNFIAKTTNSGINWNNISKKINTDMLVKFFDQNTGYISGVRGIFAKSFDGGNTWTKMPIGTLEKLELCFLNLNTGWLLSGDRKVYKTTNAGINWSITNLNTTQQLFNIYFADQNKGWISGDSGTILYSSNSGSNWSTLNTAVHSKILKTVQFSNQNLAAITMDSIILVSTNMGINWSENYIPEENWIFDVCITDNNSAYAFSYKYIFKTSNSGLNWTKVNNDLQNGGKDVNYIGSTFYVVTGSNVYKSVNGGINWANSELNNSPYTCYSISYINENTGWVAGESGSLFRNNNSTAIGIEPISNEIPIQFLLFQNYPNPFNPETSIKFDLPENTFVKFVVFDITGKEIEVLVNEHLKKGSYDIKWNAANLPSGIYFYRLITEKFSDSRKMILIK